MIRKLLTQLFMIFFIIMSLDYLSMSFSFMKMIPLKIYLIVAISSYIGLQSLLKIQENFENEMEEEMESEMEEEEMESEMEEEEMESEMEEEEMEPEMEEEEMEPEMEEEEMEPEKPKTNAELSSEIPNQMADKSATEVKEQQVEKVNELIEQEKEPKEDLKKIQDKYIIMPIESWIKNDINLMKEKILAESCSCPTVLNDSYATY